MGWRDPRAARDPARADPANRPNRHPYPHLAVALAQTGELGLSASQYGSLRVRPTAPVKRRKPHNEQSRSPIHLDRSLVEAGEALRLALLGGLFRGEQPPVLSDRLNYRMSRP